MAAGGIEPLPFDWPGDHCSHIVAVNPVIKTFQLRSNEYQFNSGI